ncbi:hypothetical protein [Microbacterium sp. 18062]|uniref:hypothetical protein n=1 Tax=Microbacterium sp. 18062 TaxID=2681410 RepID=UPI00135BCEC9|nr:hypothetical protein [Microbacterium sp. 18062]
MPDLWCIAGDADATGCRLAEVLLDDGQRVAVVTTDVAPFAMLVNAHGDAFLPIEVGAVEGQPSSRAVSAIEENDAIVGVILVTSIEAEHTPLADAIGAMMHRWPDAVVVDLSG